MKFFDRMVPILPESKCNWENVFYMRRTIYMRHAVIEERMIYVKGIA